MNVSTLVSDLMATSDAARGMETFLEDAVCIIQARWFAMLWVWESCSERQGTEKWKKLLSYNKWYAHMSVSLKARNPVLV